MSLNISSEDQKFVASDVGHSYHRKTSSELTLKFWRLIKEMNEEFREVFKSEEEIKEEINIRFNCLPINAIKLIDSLIDDYTIVETIDCDNQIGFRYSLFDLRFQNIYKFLNYLLL